MELIGHLLNSVSVAYKGIKWKIKKIELKNEEVRKEDENIKVPQVLAGIKPPSNKDEKGKNIPLRLSGASLKQIAKLVPEGMPFKKGKMIPEREAVVRPKMRVGIKCKRGRVKTWPLGTYQHFTTKIRYSIG